MGNNSFTEVSRGEYDVSINSPPASVLDIGANEGAFTEWASKRWPQAIIHAFEPIPENAQEFLKRHSNNSQVRFMASAVSTQERLNMRYGLNNSGECSAYDLGEQSQRSIVVPTIHPAKIPACEFVKIDTEGCELEIVKGLDLSQTRAIAVEYHRLSDRNEITNYLLAQGFKMESTILHRLDAGMERGVLRLTRELPAVKPVKVFIAVPSYFHIDPHFHRSLLLTFGWLANQSNLPDTIHGEVVHSFGDSPHVGRSRNMLTRQFLEGDYTDLLFIDSDLVFSVDHVKRILGHPEEVVGGLYFKKCQGEPEPCINSVANPIIKDSGLTQVAYIGTGFMRIKRCVFEEIIKRWGNEIAYCPDGTRDLIEYNFWNLAMHTFDEKVIGVSPERVELLALKYGVSHELAAKAIRSRWLSEDWWFCQRCMDLGIQVWADRHIALKHSGNVLYPLITQQEKIFDSRKAADSAGIVAKSPTCAVPV